MHIDSKCACLVTSACATWQLIQGKNSGEGARTMTKGGTEKDATQKSNEQENAENVAKFAGIDRHQRCCLILQPST